MLFHAELLVRYYNRSLQHHAKRWIDVAAAGALVGLVSPALRRNSQCLENVWRVFMKTSTPCTPHRSLRIWCMRHIVFFSVYAQYCAHLSGNNGRTHRMHRKLHNCSQRIAKFWRLGQRQHFMRCLVFLYARSLLCARWLSKKSILPAARKKIVYSKIIRWSSRRQSSKVRYVIYLCMDKHKHDAHAYYTFLKCLVRGLPVCGPSSNGCACLYADVLLPGLVLELEQMFTMTFKKPLPGRSLPRATERL